MHAALQNLYDEAFEGFGIVEMVEVDDAIILYHGVEYFSYQGFGLFVDGGTGLYIDNLTKEAHDEVAHLSLLFVKRLVVAQFFADASANCHQFFVEIFCQTIDGIAYESVEMETYASDSFAQDGIQLLSLFCFEKGYDARNEVGRCGKTDSGIGSSSEHYKCEGRVFAIEQLLGELVA